MIIYFLEDAQKKNSAKPSSKSSEIIKEPIFESYSESSALIEKLRVKDPVNKWFGANLYSIINYNQKHYIHPDDWHILENYPYINSMHQCIGKEDNYLMLNFGDKIFRILEKYIHTVPYKEPKFKPLEDVKFYSSKGKLEFGIIKGISWHNNDGKHIYSIEVNEKMKTRRYFEEDLDRVIATDTI
ncbi:hypothetical protein GCM10027442_20610 [Emticicia fontis]